jgi:hypothetical protein
VRVNRWCLSNQCTKVRYWDSHKSVPLSLEHPREVAVLGDDERAVGGGRGIMQRLVCLRAATVVGVRLEGVGLCGRDAVAEHPSEAHRRFIGGMDTGFDRLIGYWAWDGATSSC